MEYSTFIIKSLEKASKIALHYYGNVHGETKQGDNNQVLTEADLAIGKLLIQEITREYPTHNIIDEESGVIDKNSPLTWVIDPIDGTSNFAVGVPTYGIMVGLLEKGDVIASGISLPFFNELYIAEKNVGTTCNGKKVTVSAESELRNCLVAFGMDSEVKNPDITNKNSVVLGHLINRVRNIRTSHSAYDLVQIAKGSYGGLVDFNTYRIWDSVAPHLIIKEAGGMYTDIKGEPITYMDPTKKINTFYSVCAATPILHEQLQKIIHDRDN